MTELVTGQIESLVPLTEFVYQLRVRMPNAISFKAGQYLLICLTEEDKRPFSIASAPGSDALELHIGAAEHDVSKLRKAFMCSSCHLETLTCTKASVLCC